MTLINSKEQLEQILPYKNYEFLKYPTKYPVLVKFDWIDSGIIGEHIQLSMIQIPEDVDFNSFLKGVWAQPEVFSESQSFGKKKNN